jgi:hypothetical protein
MFQISHKKKRIRIYNEKSSLLFQYFYMFSVTLASKSYFIVETAIYLFSNKLVVLDCWLKKVTS